MPRLAFVSPVLCAGLVFAQSPPAALNPTVPWLDLTLARDADTVLAFGVTQTPSGYLHVSRSTDGGRTFPVVERTLAFLSGIPMRGVIGGARLAGDDAYVLVGVPWAGPFVLSSHDGGASWSPGTRVSAAHSFLPPARSLLFADGLEVAVVFPEPRANGKLWANFSADGGATWLPQDMPLDAGLATGGSGQFLTTATGPELHVYWVYTLSGYSQCMHQRSLDGGATWWPTPQPLGPIAALRGAGTPAVQFLCDQQPPFCVRSVDRGATWLQAAIPGVPYVHTVAAREQTILVVGASASVVPADLLLQVSSDAGATWLPVPYAIGYYRNATFEAAVTATSLVVNCAFQDTRSPPAALIQSDDLGGSWRLVSGAIDERLLGSDDGLLAVGSATSGTYRAWAVEGHTRHGTGGGAVRLHGHGLAGLGLSFTLAVRGAPAGALGGFFATFDPLTAQLVGDQTLYVALPHFARGFTTDGSGEARFEVPVPVSTSFAGMRLATQSFVVDPARAFGFVATNAVESWLQ